MFSQEAIKNANACSICWMCRHLCPIGNVTGREIHFPRGKATLVALTDRGNDVLKDSQSAMFECLFCNACADWCETGYEPVKFIREARRELVINDYLPTEVRKVAQSALDDAGSIYGKKQFSGALGSEIKKLPKKAKTLLVLGDAIAMNQPEIGLAAISLLKKAGVDFTVLQNEPSAGADLYDLIGEVEDVRNVARDFAKAVNLVGCEMIVSADPHVSRVLIQDYPRWDCAIPPVKTLTNYVSELIDGGKLAVREKLAETVTYHDNERLARDLKETAPARRIITAVADSFSEIFLNRNNTRSCGNDLVGAYSPDIIRMTGRARMDDALRTGGKLLITASPSDKGILSRVGEEGVRVEDIFVLADECCEGANAK